MAVRLPRLDKALVIDAAFDDRLREGFDQLHTHRILEVARAFRDGEAIIPQKGTFPRREYTRHESRARSRKHHTKLVSLDQEIDRMTEKERQLKTSDKVYKFVHDRRTTTTLMLAQTVARLPKLDMAQVHHRGGAQADGQMAETERSAPRRSGEGVQNNRGERERRGRRMDGPQTDRQAHREQGRESEGLSPLASSRKSPVKASEEVRKVRTTLK